jgi:hypothetical protein
MAAGVGGIEFTGTATYTQSAHVAGASCNVCHMATASGLAGGHSFSAVGNFNGCAATGCHSSTTSAKDLYTAAKTEITTLLTTLEDEINALGGTNGDILQAEEDGTYHGYLSIYDPSSNPNGNYKNPGSTSSWTQAQKDINAALPSMVLTNAQFGAILNYQMVYRGGGMGVHNKPYMKALLQNTIETI